MSLIIRKNEIWKPVVGFEMYYVSNLGNVRSNYYNKELQLLEDSDGYHRVNLYKNKKLYRFGVHNLVYEAFNGGLINDVTHHINHKRNDNRLENLERVSFRKNAQLKKENYSSEFHGVSYNKKLKKYVSNLFFNNKSYYLGVFENEKEASEFYNNALDCLKKGMDVNVKKPKFTSKYKGVAICPQTKKWKAYITVKGKTKHLGRFNSEKEAYNKTLQKCL